MAIATRMLPAGTVAPPDIWFHTTTGKIETVRNEMGPLGAHFGVMPIAFGQTKLTDVARTVGSGSVHHQGDGGESFSYLCYTLNSSGKSVRLWLTSTELGGGEYVEGLSVLTLAGSPSYGTETCPVLDLYSWRVTLDNGLSVGMRKDDVIQMFGMPSKQSGHMIAYRYQTTRIKNAITYDVDGDVYIYSEGGIVRGFSASLTETS
ncbi:hypothetical protein [Asticcacaulis sp.]|uniref:hypothetical protein n=1 Tax=Asticcacaulis sp. TaxID=1872648 RepID=UPI003F7C152A